MNPRLSVAVEPRYFDGASRRSQALAFALSHTVRPISHVWAHLPFDFFPHNIIEFAAAALPVPAGTRWRTVKLSKCRAEFLQAANVDDLHSGNARVTLYFHGGAFLACGVNTHRRLVSRISHRSGQPVFNVDYRQMPEASISTSIEDGVDALRWLIAQGYAPENITIAGDSAGGFMAFAVTRAALDRGIGRPAGVVALSPWLDLDNGARDAHPNRDRCQTFTHDALTRAGAVADRVERKRGTGRHHPSPVDMYVSDMPPVLIQVGSHEILMPDAEAMANRLGAAGVPCDLQVWDRQAHVFQAASAWVPEAKAAIEEIATFIRGLQAAAARPRRARVRSVSA